MKIGKVVNLSDGSKGIMPTEQQMNDATQRRVIELSQKVPLLFYDVAHLRKWVIVALVSLGCMWFALAGIVWNLHS